MNHLARSCGPQTYSPDCRMMPYAARKAIGEDLMTRTIRLCALALIATACTTAATAGPPPEIAARTELHAIQTLTLSDAQFLKGDSEAKATTVSGQLRVAQGNGRLPVVVLMHGSGGIGPNVDMWTKELNAIGIS